MVDRCGRSRRRNDQTERNGWAWAGSRRRPFVLRTRAAVVPASGLRTFVVTIVYSFGSAFPTAPGTHRATTPLSLDQTSDIPARNERTSYGQKARRA
jgi:hypothetical protein